MASGEKTRPEIQVLSRTVDPQAEAWIRSIAFGEMNFINQQLLTQEAEQAKDKAQDIDGSLAGYQSDFEDLQQNLDEMDIERTRQDIQDLIHKLNDLLSILHPESLAQHKL